MIMAHDKLDNVTEALVLAAQGVSPTVRLVGGAGLALLLGHRKSADVDLFAERDEPLLPDGSRNRQQAVYYCSPTCVFRASSCQEARKGVSGHAALLETQKCRRGRVGPFWGRSCA
jgi:hypothetical protein